MGCSPITCPISASPSSSCACCRSPKKKGTCFSSVLRCWIFCQSSTFFHTLKVEPQDNPLMYSNGSYSTLSTSVIITSSLNVDNVSIEDNDSSSRSTSDALSTAMLLEGVYISFISHEELGSFQILMPSKCLMTNLFLQC
eukprot:NODE_25_length_35605_cov_0.353461.p15 type:complete len:140 gc:universal NODE_25_length_35605_cov_0.353461:20730-21149(+)